MTVIWNNIIHFLPAAELVFLIIFFLYILKKFIDEKKSEENELNVKKKQEKDEWMD